MRDAHINEPITDTPLTGSPPHDKKTIYSNVSKDPEGLKNQITAYEDGKTKFDVVSIIDLMLKGNSAKDVVTIIDPKGELEIKVEYVEQLYSKYKPDLDLEEIQVYKHYRKDLATKLEKKAMEKFEYKLDHGGATLGDYARAFSTAFDKRRLEEDKSTSNVATKHSTIIKNIADRRRKEYQDE